jgi:hypothetical protein
MSSIYRLDPNRANAQKATNMNALKHGTDAASAVIPGEDPAEYERVAADYQSDLRPTTALEHFQVNIMIRSDWQRRRLERIEANLYRELLTEGATPGEIDVKVLRDSATGRLLRKVWSQIASLERASSRALAEIRRLRRERAQEAASQEMAQPAAPVKTEPPVRNEPNSKPKSDSPRTPFDLVLTR